MQSTGELSRSLCVVFARNLVRTDCTARPTPDSPIGPRALTHFRFQNIRRTSPPTCSLSADNTETYCGDIVIIIRPRQVIPRDCLCTTAVVDDAISWACLSTFATTALEAVAAAGRIPRGSIRAHAAGVNVPYLSAHTYTYTPHRSVYIIVSHRHTDIHTHTHAHTHTRTDAQTHTRIHAHTHTVFTTYHHVITAPDVFSSPKFIIFFPRLPINYCRTNCTRLV